MIMTATLNQSTNPAKCWSCDGLTQWHSQQWVDSPWGKQPMQVFECTNCGQLRAMAGGLYPSPENGGQTE